MRFRDVRIAALAPALPERVVTSEELEQRLSPVYEALRLRVGRLELMSGIRERRFWDPGTLPSDASIAAARRALGEAGIDPARIGLVVHSAVCRDFMEPATATVVHAALGLAHHCAAFDLSNACLGFAHAMTVAAGQIERGDLEAALVVAGEDGGPLVEATIEQLLGAESVGKAELKRAFASLTIGSGGAAAVLCHADLAPDGARLRGGLLRAATEHNHLCRGDRVEGASGPLMETDSEALLVAGCALAAETWPRFLEELEWSASDVDRIVTHQVGVAHRRALLGSIGVDPQLDWPTVEVLGNIGSVSLPATYALAREAGHIVAGQRVALLGIGSGLQCLMLGVEV
ncbi:3-oxoacyl-ACP synthase III [Engelhardtia mirabilis]|uniref:PQB biosynthetic 3-oxoacyl-[acyl-carrier-protein] synthase III n=1 Tax=Engelhardtia mirabilis TaxID=2528011 RepID=A0A518BIE2_9BACT|nr:PQB biosynthetic 3-oxoacyl-[acyl-carrier-protein] synthase III [Planctomycetes bacterium Pla133]QDV01061.1 PQB biosynthetic 3-oxoacyl-[acyl-carrier-protein] synthase III [Planctomycetes bacterium Pla86]